jgi:MerR family transcriptional regulator, light-induced transcriptional regulator
MMSHVMRKSSANPVQAGGMLSIGALARATGIPVETLRTWETRYGFPAAERKPSGHRVYPPHVVPRLRRMAMAISQGHRAGEIVPASDEALDQLLAVVSRPPASPGIPAAVGIETTGDLLNLVEAFDGDRLTAALLADWARLTPVSFIADRIAPLLQEVGERWAAGRLGIRHEHFLSERLGDLLGSLRMPFDRRATGPHVICATLPGEAHSLGIQAAALILAAAGLRVAYLGTQTPAGEIASLARELPARFVAISLSAAARPKPSVRQLGELRQALPRGTTLLAGGAGATPARGVVVIDEPAKLDAWARRVCGGGESATAG